MGYQTQQPSRAPASQGQQSSSESSTSTSNSAVAQGTATGADPSNRTDGAGTATTEHAAPGVEMGEGIQAPEASENVSRDGRVRILADSSHPIVGSSVSEFQLFEEIVVSEEEECVSDPDLHDIVGQNGTASRPSVYQGLAADAMYINGTPSVMDVRQGGLSDCFFEAALINVAGQDSGHITSSITAAGSTISVQFYKYDAGTNAWTPVTVSVENTLAVNSDDFSLVGAGFNVAPTPKESSWYAEVNDNVLWVNRDDTHEAALWAPLMEKAYCAFAETYGQYGGFDTANANTGTSGYDVVEGGIHEYMYSVLYGPRATTGMTSINVTPGSDVVMANQAAIENLLRVNGDPSLNGAEFMMNSQLSPDDAVNHLSVQTDYILGLDSSHRYRTLRTHLVALQSEIVAWNAASGPAKDTARDVIIRRAVNLCTDGNWPLLHSSSAPEEYTILNEYANVVSTLGDDESSGQRLVYAWHSYSVRGASFVGKDGAPMALTIANIATNLANIDGTASTVQMQNPHHANEPDPHGRGIADGADDGVFSMPLDQYLRNFTEQQGATIAP